MNDKIIELAPEIGGETGSYLQPFLYRALEKNNEAIAKNLKQFMPWFKERGARCHESKSCHKIEWGI